MYTFVREGCATLRPVGALVYSARTSPERATIPFRKSFCSNGISMDIQVRVIDRVIFVRTGDCFPEGSWINNFPSSKR